MFPNKMRKKQIPNPSHSWDKGATGRVSWIDPGDEAVSRALSYIFQDISGAGWTLVGRVGTPSEEEIISESWLTRSSCVSKVIFNHFHIILYSRLVYFNLRVVWLVRSVYLDPNKNGAWFEKNKCRKFVQRNGRSVPAMTLILWLKDERLTKITLFF